MNNESGILHRATMRVVGVTLVVAVMFIIGWRESDCRCFEDDRTDSLADCITCGETTLRATGKLVPVDHGFRVTVEGTRQCRTWRDYTVYWAGVVWQDWRSL